mmetsp:Transcript_7734/g.8850  ORF Transcript_7734/g.8850 Transcript_7734/m.8850 type:complete len:279 (-) Transcript_7734:1710-2546(-)
MLMQIWLEPTFKKAYYAQFFYVLVSLSAVAFGSVAYNENKDGLILAFTFAMVADFLCSTMVLWALKNYNLELKSQSASDDTTQATDERFPEYVAGHRKDRSAVSFSKFMLFLVGASCFILAFIGIGTEEQDGHLYTDTSYVVASYIYFNLILFKAMMKLQYGRVLKFGSLIKSSMMSLVGATMSFVIFIDSVFSQTAEVKGKEFFGLWWIDYGLLVLSIFIVGAETLTFAARFLSNKKGKNDDFDQESSLRSIDIMVHVLLGNMLIYLMFSFRYKNQA